MYDEQKHCCTVCDSKHKCHVCGTQTNLACSDCAIDLGVTVYVCSKTECRDQHERKCGHALRAELEQARQDLQKCERDIGLALQDRMDEQKLREASESREKKLKEALEKIAELKPTADNPFYALRSHRTIREIKEIARRALEGE